MKTTTVVTPEMVAKVFNLDQCREITALSEKGFEKHAKLIYSKKDRFQTTYQYRGSGWTQSEPQVRRLFFKDNGSSVLAVAHLDSVQTTNWCEILAIPDCPLLFSPRLDDRLGVYVLLYLLPALGIKVDVLLTNGEESGNSSAELFKTKKDYNWMFMFDRKGDDVVMYQYMDDKYKALLAEYGWKEVAYGAFSDIGKLEHLGIKGFNFGVGYHDYHAMMAYCKMSQLFSQVAKFCNFYADVKDIKMPHKSRKSRLYGSQDEEWDGDAGVYRPRGGVSITLPRREQLALQTTPQVSEERLSGDGVICNACGRETDTNTASSLGRCHFCGGYFSFAQPLGGE